MSLNRTERRCLAALLLLAAGLRIAACAVWREDFSRDPDAYYGLAERLLDGRGYVAPDGRPTAYRPPLYPLLLGGVLWAGSAGIAVLQIALGVATVALTASLGRRLGLGRWSLLAAALVAVDPLLLRYTPQVMTEVTCAFLGALVLWLAADRSLTFSSGPTDRLRLPPPSPPGEGGRMRRESGRSFRTVQRWRHFLLGVAFGLALLARPTFWAFGLLVAAAWLWGRIGPRHRNHEPAGLTDAAVVLLGVAIVVAPWAIRNAVAIERPIVTTTHGGYTLLLANNPVFWREVVTGPPGAAWDGESLDAWQRSLETAMARYGVPSANEPARDRWMRDRAIGHIRRHPDLFLRSVLYRVGRLWDVAPIGPGAASLPRVLRWGVATFYLFAFVLAAVGGLRIGLAARQSRIRAANFGERPDTGGQDQPLPDGRGSEARITEYRASWMPLFLLILAYTAVHALYWTDVRMRAPLVPAVALLAARALTGVPLPRRRISAAET